MACHPPTLPALQGHPLTRSSPEEWRQDEQEQLHPSLSRCCGRQVELCWAAGGGRRRRGDGDAAILDLLLRAHSSTHGSWAPALGVLHVLTASKERAVLTPAAREAACRAQGAGRRAQEQPKCICSSLQPDAVLWPTEGSERMCTRREAARGMDTVPAGGGSPRPALPSPGAAWSRAVPLPGAPNMGSAPQGSPGTEEGAEGAEGLLPPREDPLLGLQPVLVPALPGAGWVLQWGQDSPMPPALPGGWGGRPGTPPGTISGSLRPLPQPILRGWEPREQQWEPQDSPTDEAALPEFSGTSGERGA